MTSPVTLITGSSRGIGRHLAEYYLHRSHTVIGCSRSDSDLTNDAYTHVRLDATDEAGVRDLFSRIRKDFGRLDHLINNAGIASMNHTLTTPIDTVGKLLATNTTAAFLFAREAAKLMMLNRFGRIVNFTSVAVRLNLEGEAAYVASKAAVEALTRVWAREFAPFGITSNAVGPTPVETDLIAKVPREKIQSLIERQAVRRMGTMEDVSNVVDFFLRKESNFVTGQVLFLGGV